MKNIAIFASGSGSNAERIAVYFKKIKTVKVSLILSNNKNAFVLERAKKLNIPSVVVEKEKVKEGVFLIDLLKRNCIDFIVLAGFLLKIPKNLIEVYPYKIINIHPALLPKYGGKGMYGNNVHKAVLDNEEKESGISIHYVNENYDEGDIIFQARVNINAGESLESLCEKIHKLEHEHYPKIIEKLLC